MPEFKESFRSAEATGQSGQSSTVEARHTESFAEVQTREIESINAWRAANRRKPIENLDHAAAGLQAIAISGGGIRSASFALGALQAMDQELAKDADGKPAADLRSGLGLIDYLSTVSGGGYIGCSLRVGMDRLGGAFPFSTGPDDKADNQAVGHIRNHSRYLIPNGLRDIFSDIAVILRGLAANLILVLGFVLLCAAFTIFCNPNQTALETPDILGITEFPGKSFVRSLGAFAFTKLLVFAGTVAFCIWAVLKSRDETSLTEFAGPSARWNKWMVRWLLLTLLVAFLEFQPFVLAALFQSYRGGAGQSGFIDWVAAFVARVTPYLAPLSVAGAFLSKLVGDAAKAGENETGFRAVLQIVIAKAAMAVIALTLPLLIWASYLYITLWGDLGFSYGPDWLKAFKAQACGSDAGGLAGFLCAEGRLMAWVYFAGVVLTGLLCYMLKPNANSLHRLYRDRLSKAFLFDPTSGKSQRLAYDEIDLPSLDQVKLSELAPSHGPVPIINAALNIQGSRYANRRGRNADFFSFSPLYCGSKGTGFVSTSELEPVEKGLDVATAMAVSGAAASSNMGSNTLRGLAPTLALLNIRLGYWMRNPRNFATLLDPATSKLDNLYFLQEMLGLLHERSNQIYLTDGGHIENLGLYELLRRRCARIVVIDAEADPEYTFSSLVTVQRYARIDLGIKIELPWQRIRDGALSLDAQLNGKDSGAEKGERVHVAVGTIEYQDEGISKAFTGRIIYIKASMTGDENDYVADYKRRHPRFPHETTGDQFFSEEQFEAYRSLGFHAARRAFSGADRVAGSLPPASADGKSSSRAPLRSLFV